MVIRHEYIESLLCAIILELNPNNVMKKTSFWSLDFHETLQSLASSLLVYLIKFLSI